MAEKFRRFTPYNYGDDNPVRNIDPDGMGPASTIVEKLKDNTYKVVGGKADGDNNVYLKGTKKVIAKSVTDHSFLLDNGTAVVGAIINLSNKKGTEFLNNKIIGDDKLKILDYMANAKGGQKYDFKTNGPNGEVNWINKVPQAQQDAYKYRGGVVDNVPGLSSESNVPTVASARDIGNIGAGYEAGLNDVPWPVFRWKADKLQSSQVGHPDVESQTTQLAERTGFLLGEMAFHKLIWQ